MHQAPRPYSISHALSTSEAMRASSEQVHTTCFDFASRRRSSSSAFGGAVPARRSPHARKHGASGVLLTPTVSPDAVVPLRRRLIAAKRSDGSASPDRRRRCCSSPRRSTLATSLSCHRWARLAFCSSARGVRATGEWRRAHVQVVHQHSWVARLPAGRAS